jgi:hypothetical protein
MQHIYIYIQGQSNPCRTSGIFFAIVTKFQAFRFRLHENEKEDDDKDDTFIKLTI